MLRALLSMLSILLSASLFAQNGSISGTVTDAASGETVVGANVVIQGTSVGAATDIDGKFLIQNVKPGVYALSVTFVTYKAHTIPDVVVESGKITNIQVQMQEDVSTLEEVVITGVREVNTDLSLISAIKQSKLVVTGISAQQISMSQDRDAAQVVRRVPGVTLQDNRFVVVRGLSSRYSNVMLNGILAPSTETDMRAFSFDVIPSGLIDRMLIYKSGSPELPGDFAGSVIQVDTKSGVEENFTNASLSFGFRANTTFTNRQMQQGSSTDFLGFDNGFRDLPQGAPSNYNTLGFDVNSIEAESRKFNNSWGLEEVNVRPDVRFNIDLGRRFNIGRFNVSGVNSLSYSNTHQFNRIGFNRFQNYTEDGNGDFTSEDLFRYNDDMYTNNVRIGLLSNWTLNYSDRTKIEFKNLYNRIGSSQTTVREGANFFREQYYRNYSLRYIERTIYSGQVQGTHDLRPDKSKLSWVVGFTSAARNEPDWKRAVTARPLTSGESTPFVVEIPNNASAANAARFYQALDEYNVTNRLDFSNKFETGFTADAIEFTTGYWLEYKDRSFQARQIGHTRGLVLDPSIANQELGDIFSTGNVSFLTGHRISEGTKITDSYNASNLLTAGYFAFDLPFSDDFRVKTGLRVEHNIQKLQTPVGPGDANVNNPITSFLPSVNMSYNLNTLSLVRLAYSKTVNRPEFRELAPFQFYDFDNDVNIIGNDRLTHSDIHNIDLKWEMYPTPAEQISAGVFYKNFNNPIETNIDNGTDSPVFLFNNAENAQTYGVEVEIRKSLAYTSSSRFLNNTSVVFNASYIVSQINLDDRGGSLQEASSRPMQGQSPYVINAGLFYNDEDNGLQASAQYNVFGKRIAFVGLPGQPTWWEMPRHVVDLTFSKRIGAKTDLRLGVSDLLNAKWYIKEDANLDNDVREQSTNREVRSTRNGQYVTVGVAVKF